MPNQENVRTLRFIPHNAPRERLLSGSALRIVQEIETLHFGHSLGGEFRPRRVIGR